MAKYEKNAEREFSDLRVPTDNDGNPFPDHIVERGEELPNGISLDDVSPDESVEGAARPWDDEEDEYDGYYDYPEDDPGHKNLNGVGEDTFDRFLHFLTATGFPVSGVEKVRYDRYEGSLHEVFSIERRR